MGQFTASMENWTAKAKANLDQVILGSIEDLFTLATRRQASIKETGTYMEGYVPVDLGILIASSRLAINGMVVGQGTLAGGNSAPPDFAVGLLNMDMGDTATLYFTANYAPHVEYGTRYMGGRFFVRNAVMQWERIVEANAAYIGAP